MVARPDWTRRLLYLNGLAILAALLNHACGWGTIAMFIWTHRYLPVAVPNFDQVGTLSYYVLRVAGQLVAFAIPAFVFVSGYFVAYASARSKGTISWQTIRSQVVHLGIPYLVWCGIAVAGLALEGQSTNYLLAILTGSVKGPYYFVPLLIQLYLISPVLVALARHRWRLLLVSTAIAQIACQLLLYNLALDLETPFLPRRFHVPNWLFPTRVWWFALGIVAGFHLQPLKAWLDRRRRLMQMVAIIFFVVGCVEGEMIFRVSHFIVSVETVVDSLYALSVIAVFLGRERFAPPLLRLVERVGAASYGLYLAHVPAQEYFARAVYHVAPWMLGNQWILLPALFVAGLGGPLMLMAVGRRSPARSYYRLIFG